MSPPAALNPIAPILDTANAATHGVDGHVIDLAIRPDPYCAIDSRSHQQWFNFRVVGAAGAPLELRIVNAGDASYPTAWNGYQACASYDLQDWFRVPTSFDAASGTLTIRHTPQHDAVHFAYFAPYSLERHAATLARLQARSRPGCAVRLAVLGRSAEGRDLDCVQVGGSEDAVADGAGGPLRVWVTARQHPGESMAEWFAEGLLERLTDPDDGIARSLLRKATFYVVPNMCPDGSFRGHLRTNALGFNLNRAWAAPSLKHSPEVYHTLAAMDRTGVDMFVDVHGDEELPHVFMAGLDGIPRFGPRLEALQDAFTEAFTRHAPEFQTVHGYGKAAPGKANLTIASKQIGERFDCLSFTLEMPFKDSAEVPDPRVGWSAGRAKRLGAAMLGAIHDVADRLR